jgi:hypothetical protein
MLTWLIDPNENHYCGDLFLKRLLFEIVSKESNVKTAFDIAKKKYGALQIQNSRFSDSVIFREYSAGEGNEKIDICVFNEAMKLFIFIENKIGSKEGINQKDKYYQYLSKLYSKNNYCCFFVYIDYEGEFTASCDAGWAHLNYEWVTDEIQQIYITKRINPDTRKILMDYYEYLTEESLDKTFNDEYLKRVLKVKKNIVCFLNILTKY